jgi:hypothetical protein
MNPTEFRRGVIKPIECYKEAWELIKDKFWLLLAVVFVGGMIGGASMYILIGAMTCGIYFCYLKVIDRKDFKFEDLFKGFSVWLPGLIVGIFVFVPIIALYAIIYVPTLVAVMANPQIKPEELVAVLGVSFAVDIVFTIFMVCFHTLIMFAFPLIIDKNLSAFQAMKTSARAVWANLGGVAGLFGVGFVLCLIGMMAACIGIYFVIPLMMGANTLAYRKIFPSAETVNLNPPPPNYYQGI